MIELTEAQRQGLKEANPPRVIDPQTRKAYVLVPADVYDRLKALLGGGEALDPEETYALLDESFREGWDDPKMAEYDRYEDHKR